MKTLIISALVAFSFSAQAKECDNKKPNELSGLSDVARKIQSDVSGDSRTEINRNLPQFKQLNSIGMVSEDGKNFYGTAFLVSPCHVLTNYHVAFDENEKPRKNKNLLFSVGQTGDKQKPFQYNIAGKVIEYGFKDKYLSTVHSDWAVVKLTQSIGKKMGYIEMLPMDSADMVTQKVITGGFPSDLSVQHNYSVMYGDFNCKINGITGDGFISHTCLTTNGQSGSPLLILMNNKYYAIGLVSGSPKGQTGLRRSTDANFANAAATFESGKPYDFISDGDQIIDIVNNNKCD